METPNPDNESEMELQVRYSETDAMRFVYYANYLVYFEVARTSALASRQRASTRPAAGSGT